MNEEKWIAWKMQTSKTWQDMEDVLKYINIDFIDYDHKILVEYALKLNKIINQSEAEFTLETLGEIHDLLDQLYGYAVEHFDREEAFMEQYDLPGVPTHKREHERILKMLRSALDDFALGKVKVSHKLKTQVMDWLIGHINVTDYHFFDIHNWSKNLVNASDWKQVRDIIKLTGIKDIDQQHKELTERAINLMLLLSQEVDELAIRDGFNSFRDYVIMHFEYENTFMDEYEIEDVAEHLSKHDYFVQRLVDLPDEILDGRTHADELKVWILTWWIDHINVTDKETFDYKRWAHRAIDKAQVIEDISEILRLTHIDSIDHDHLTVMEKTLELNNMIAKHYGEEGKVVSKEGKEAIISMFRVIYGLAERHFAREEVIMNRHRMTDLLSHSTEHGEILLRLRTMLANYEEDRLYVSNNVKTMILDWWIHHTNNIDYRTFVTNLEPTMAEKIQKEEKSYEQL